MKAAVRVLAVLTIAAAALLASSYGFAVSDPVLRSTSVRLAGWPGGAPTIRALLISDLHVAGPDMTPDRLKRIVAQINGLAPDIVLIAGDLVSDKRVATRRYEMAEAIAPLADLKPRIGAFAVLGNHDHWRDAAAARVALASAGITVLENDATRAGPVAIGGLDDDFTGRADMPATLAALRSLPGPRILLSHSPDPFPEVPAEVALMLAGHTHCGQIALPFIGPVATMSRHGERYACGIVREAGKTLVVSAGLGTSLLPLRFGAPPDMWLIELGPA